MAARPALWLGVVAAIAAANAAAAGIDPHNFDVELTELPQIAPTTGSADVVLNGVRMAGTVRERGTSRSGRLEASCDFELHTRVEAASASASGSQRCSWLMRFDDGSLTGTLEGTSRTEATLSGGTMTSTLTVSVVAGTGVFSGKVGSGTFTQSERLPGAPPKPTTPPPAPPPTPPQPPAPPQPPVPPPPPPAPPTSPLVRATAAVQKGSLLKLRLRPGQAGAGIAAPGKTLSARVDPGLRVVSAPGASCSGVATSGGRRVDLGRAADTNRDGLVVVAKRLRPRLAAGTWSIVVECSVGGREATARRSVRVR